MTNNILVLGAGSLQVPLIQTVKSRGYRAIVVSLYEDEPGMQIADEKVIADFCDEDIILDYALKYDICGILTDQTDILDARKVSGARNSDHTFQISVRYWRRYIIL